MCRAASLVIPGSGGATGLGRRALLQHRGGPFVPAASAAPSHRGKPLLRRRMRNPPDFPVPLTLQPPRGCHSDREGGNVGKTPLATRPRRPCGELHSGSSRFPRTAWALGRWRIPLVPRDLQRLAHAHEKCNPPLPRTGKAQVKNKLLCACAELPFLTPSRSRGFPSPSAQARAGIPGDANLLQNKGCSLVFPHLSA